MSVRLECSLHLRKEGLEIMAGQRTMSGQMFGRLDILSGRLQFLRKKINSEIFCSVE